MPLFQSSIVRVSVFQNGTELFGDCIVAAINDWLVECANGRVTIRVENLSDKAFTTSAMGHRRLPLLPGASREFHLQVEYREYTVLRWKQVNTMSILFLAE